MNKVGTKTAAHAAVSAIPLSSLPPFSSALKILS